MFLWILYIYIVDLTYDINHSYKSYIKKKSIVQLSWFLFDNSMYSQKNTQVLPRHVSILLRSIILIAQFLFYISKILSKLLLFKLQFAFEIFINNYNEF